jgi:hypothetical protein
LTREQDKEKNNRSLISNPFVAGAAVWQSLTTYWFNACGEFLKHAPKMSEDWYNAFCKPGPQQQHQQRQDRDKVNGE